MSDLVKQLRNGICQDQYDEIEIYETEQIMREAADRIEALEAQLAKADALAVHANTLLTQGLALGEAREIVVGNLISALTEYRAANGTTI